MLDSFWDVVTPLLGLGSDRLDAGQMAIRAVLVFAVTVAIVRVGDKRLWGKGTAFDTVVAIMLGSIMSGSVTGSTPLLATWAAGATLIAMHWLLAFLSYHLSWFGPLVKGHPVLLIKDGEVQRAGTRGSNVTPHDLAQGLRAQGEEPDPSQIQLSYLERDGSISVIPRRAQPRILDVSVADGVQTVRIALE